MNLITITELFLREHKHSEVTQRHIMSVVKLFMNETKVTTADQLSTDSLIEWREKILERKTTATTWNNYLRHIRLVINYMNENNLLKNPTNTKNLALRAKKPRPKTINLQDLKIVTDYLCSDQTRFQPYWFWLAIIRVFFYTGMRRRQLAGLRWEDVSFKNRTIHLRCGTSKNSKDWTIPASGEVLQEFSLIRQETKKVVGDDIGFEKRYIFDISLFHVRFKSVGKMKEYSITNFFNHLSKETNIQISAHRLRHTVATLLAQTGKIRSVQVLLGHTSTRTTLKYIHPSLDNVRDLVKILENAKI